MLDVCKCYIYICSDTEWRDGVEQYSFEFWYKFWFKTKTKKQNLKKCETIKDKLICHNETNQDKIDNEIGNFKLVLKLFQALKDIKIKNYIVYWGGN